MRSRCVLWALQASAFSRFAFLIPSHNRSFYYHLHHEIFQFTVDDSINFIEARTSLTFQLNANLNLITL